MDAVIWALVAVAAAVWVGRKLRPAHLGSDVLKWEIFRYLRFQNAREADGGLTYEDLEKRLWRTYFTGAAFAFVCMSFVLRVSLGFSWTSCGVTSFVIAMTFLGIWLRHSRTYRATTLPLFATLCRMPQSRWDIRSRPRAWVKLNPKKGTLWIQLPKDWNATAISLKFINDLVNARLDGHWKMTVNTRKFLISFVREIEAETVPVTQEEKRIPEDVAAFLAHADYLKGLQVNEKEVESDDSPW